MCVLCCNGAGEKCCSKCYSNWKKRSNYKGHVKYRKPRTEESAMSKPLMRRPPPIPPKGPAGRKEDYSEFEKMWPNLLAFLSEETYEDGTRRTTGTLLFFFQDGVFKACLNDRDVARSAFLSASGVHEACDALEEGLCNDNLDWRAKRSS